MNNTTTVTKKPVLEPADPKAARFCEYFYQGWDFLIAPTPAPGQKPAWKTEKAYQLEPRNLWGLYQNPNYILGLRFKKKTKYAAIDIDRHSPYHPYNNPDKYKQVLAAMESIGLCRYIVVRSSDSEGIHLYFPLPKRIWTFGLACAIKFALFDHCIELNSGIVESFPNTKPYGDNGKYTLYNGLRLPLQTGSYLLDDDFQPESDSIEDLLNNFDWAAQGQDVKQLEKAMAASYPRHKLTTYSVFNSSRAELWRQHLEERWTQGWTGFGQTNALLKDIAVYGRVWLGLESLALVDYTATTATSAPGYDSFCRHQEEIWQRAADWSKCVESYYWAYGTEPNRKGTYASHFHRDDNNCPHCTHSKNNIVDSPNNDQRSIKATERIKSAVAHLEESNSLPAAATARSHAIIATAKQLTGCGISQTTLHKPKYLVMWHPDHYHRGGETCVIDDSEQHRAITDSSSPPPTGFSAGEVEKPETAPRQESAENYTSDPYMKGSCVPSHTRPQKGECEEVFTTTRGESEGGDVPLSVPVENPPSRAAAPEEMALIPLPQTATTDGAADSEPPASTNTRDPKYTNTLDPKLSRRIKIRFSAISKAKKAVQMQALVERRRFTWQERERLETIAKMRFFWQSGEPVLMDEVREWARANPGALPEVPRS